VCDHQCHQRLGAGARDCGRSVYVGCQQCVLVPLKPRRQPIFCFNHPRCDAHSHHDAHLPASGRSLCLAISATDVSATAFRAAPALAALTAPTVLATAAAAFSASAAPTAPTVLATAATAFSASAAAPVASAHGRKHMCLFCVS